MQFNYQALQMLVEQEQLSVIGLGVELAQFTGKDAWPIPLGKLDYWIYGAGFMSSEDFTPDGWPKITGLSKKYHSLDDLMKRIKKGQIIPEPPQEHEVKLIQAFAKARGHNDLNFYLPAESLPEPRPTQ